MREVEQRLQNMPEVKALYARSMLSTSTQMAPDVIGVLQFQFNDWFTRRTATEILEDFRERTADIPGVELEFRKQEGGPAEGKPVELLVSSKQRRPGRLCGPDTTANARPGWLCRH